MKGAREANESMKHFFYSRNACCFLKDNLGKKTYLYIDLVNICLSTFFVFVYNKKSKDT